MLHVQMIDMNDPGMKQALKLTEEAVEAQSAEAPTPSCSLTPYEVAEIIDKEPLIASLIDDFKP